MSLICIEGPNGSGKTSLVNKLKKESNYKILQNPGTTNLGKLLRPICRGENQWKNLHKSVRSLLFSATRNDLYDTIENSDDIHVVDRWWMSTFVHQICIGGLPIENLESTIYPGEKIDLIILLSGDEKTLINRVYSERKSNSAHSHDIWTSNKKMLKMIIRLYKYDLPIYLDKIGMKYEIINTSQLTIDEVFEQVDIIIKHHVAG